jgi:transposase
MMRFVGIDIGGERHALAVVDEDGTVLTKSTFFGEEAAGYKRVRELLGNADDCLVAMEATGHYWRNLFAFLASLGFEVALLNPLRTRRFAEEELERTKTDSVDALGIARFAAQKRPAPTPVSDEVTAELRELVRLRTRYVDELSDRMRQLHRAVDLGFPEFTRHVRIRTLLATAILARYPTARSFARVSVRKLARLTYDGRHRVGETLTRALIEGAKVSVGNHHSEPYQLHVKYTCADIELLRGRVKQLEQDIERKLQTHEVGKLLTTIDGVGTQTAACLIAELGDPSRFRDAAALASYVGVVPRLRQSGKRAFSGARGLPLGNARLRHRLWMPTLVAVRKNPWLRAHYEHLLAVGKRPKVAIVACMRKLLGAIYSVARNRRPFVPHLATAGHEQPVTAG